MDFVFSSIWVWVWIWVWILRFGFGYGTGRILTRSYPLPSLLGTKLKLSSGYHPQADGHGQYERTIQSLEDLLRACVLDHKGSWDEFLPLVEFTYNNSFHASIGMTPYEVLYGRRCLI